MWETLYTNKLPLIQHKSKCNIEVFINILNWLLCIFSFSFKFSKFFYLFAFMVTLIFFSFLSFFLWLKILLIFFLLKRYIAFFQTHKYKLPRWTWTHHNLQHVLVDKNRTYMLENMISNSLLVPIIVMCPPASSTGLIYIDPSNLRRSSAISTSAAAAAAALEASNSSSYLTSASSLARAYSIVIRQISDLMSRIPKFNHLVYSQYPRCRQTHLSGRRQSAGEPFGLYPNRIRL